MDDTRGRGRGRGRASNRGTLGKGSRGAKVNVTNKNNKESLTSSFKINKRSGQQVR